MSKTNTLVCVMIGFLGLFGGQTLTGIPALVCSLVGFAFVMAACILSIQTIIKKRDR